MQTIRVGILGMKRLGGSFGLALRRYNESKDARQKFEVTGFDPDERLAIRAKAIGACDQFERTIGAAAANQAIVIIAMPYHEVEAVYQLIGGGLRPGTVILDTAPFKRPSEQWAKKYVHGEAFTVGLTPIISATYLFDGLDDLEHSSADTFDGGVMLVTATSGADRDAVQLAADLSGMLGASVRFTDPAEHDSWAVVVEALPALIGTAAFDSISGQANWDDVRRVTNGAFGQLTHHLLEMHPDALRDLILRERVGLIRQIDALVESLRAVRGVLAADDRDALETLLIRASDEYHTWTLRRRDGQWDKSASGVENARESAGAALLSGVFGSAIAKRLRGGGKDKS
jgi:prephenate dehydrogenase